MHERGHAGFFEHRHGRFVQAEDGMRRFICFDFADFQILFRDNVQTELAAAGIEQVRCQHGVVYAVDIIAADVQGTEKSLEIVAENFVGAQERGHIVRHSVPADERFVSVKECDLSGFRVIDDCSRSLKYPSGDGFHFRDGGFRDGFRFFFVLVQSEPLGHAGEFQFAEQVDEGGLVHRTCLKQFIGGQNRRVTADERKIAGEVRVVAARVEFFDRSGGLLEVVVFAVAVECVEGSGGLDELQRGLFADARDPGNIVGRIAHESLHIHELTGRDAVFFGEFFFGEQDILLGFRQNHSCRFVNELERVAVAGENVGFDITLFGGKRGGGTDHVVRFVAGTFDHLKAESRDGALGVGHLRLEFVGHPLAVALVVGVGEMAEGRLMHVERAGDIIRFERVEMLFQNGQQAVHGVGGQTVLRGQRPNPVKRAVDDAVAVNNQKFLHNVSFDKFFYI